MTTETATAKAKTGTASVVAAAELVALGEAAALPVDETLVPLEEGEQRDLSDLDSTAWPEGAEGERAEAGAESSGGEIELQNVAADIWAPFGAGAQTMWQTATPFTSSLAQDFVSDAAAGGNSGPAGGRDENGSGATVVGAGTSGDQRIDGLIAGNKWAGSISYSDPNSTADYQAGYPGAPLAGFSQLTGQQLLATHFALNDAVYTQPANAQGFSIEGFTGISITYFSGGSGSGTIRSSNSSDPGTAYAYYPSNSITGGDVFYGGSGTTPTAGNYHWHTVLHELGHSMGLKHGQDTSGNGALPASWDSMEFSVMTYRSYVGGPLTGYSNETWGFAQTYMMLDIAALQFMYGADFTTNGGNTVYKWNPGSGDTLVDGAVAIDAGGNRIFATIWDGNGIDTYDLSSYSTNLDIDLAPGSWSTFDSTQIANLGGGNFARANIFNAMQYNGDARSLIENAIGGSGHDRIDGNDANNVLTGNAGNDTLYGWNGNDTIYGGGGNNYNWGANGNDLIVDVGGLTAGNDDTHNGGTGTDTLQHDLNWISTVHFDLATGWTYLNGTARDRLISIENLTVGGSAQITGSADDNFLIVNGTGANLINAGGGNDTIYAGGGNDTIDGGSGNNYNWGADGDDLIIDTGGITTNDTHNGGNGTDTLQHDLNWVSSVHFDLATGRTFYGGTAYDTLFSIENLTVGGSAQITGSAADNFLIVNGTGANLINAGGGNDTIYAGGGNDTIDGGSGNNYNWGADGDDLIIDTGGITTNDTHNGGNGTDTLQHDLNWVSSVHFDLATGRTFYGGTAYDTLISIENLTVGGSAQITGSADDNFLIVNGTGANLINAGGGNDTIYAGGGNDTIDGGSGNNYNWGADGDDLIIDTGGITTNDTHNGGNGTDTLQHDLNWVSSVHFDLATGRTFYGGTAYDTLISIENLTVGGSAQITGSADDNVLTVNGTGANLINAGDGNDMIDAGGGNDTIDGGNGNDTLLGGDGDDLLVDTQSISASLNDTHNGGTGTDTLQHDLSWVSTVHFDLNAGRTFFSGTAYDTLISIENLIVGGSAQITGSADDNVLTVNGTGANLINAGDGNDTINAGGGNDTVSGGSGVDMINGDDGDDTLDGGLGVGDLVFGGGGNDLMLYMSGEGYDHFNGGAGIDTVSIDSAWSSNMTFDLVAGDYGATGFGGYNLFGVENVNAGSGNDKLIGDGSSNTLNGNDGDDTLIGADGNDTLLGGLGADIIHGGDGADSLDGGDGIDTLTYSGDTADLEIRLWNGTANGGWATGDTILNFENLTLGSGNDFAQGTTADNVIFGAAGNDTLVGLSGNDTVNGGGGDDMIFGDAGMDSLIGSIGNDTINYSPDSTGVTVQLWNNFVDGGIATGDTISGFENAIGGTGSDKLQGTLGANMLSGNSGNDTINGLGGDDTLSGDGGTDLILAGSGVEVLNGGAGWDMLSYFSDSTGVNISLIWNNASGGNAAGDTISNFENVTGGSGNDTLLGTTTSNVLRGMNGNDTLNGLNGNDTLLGGYGEDYLLGGGGNDLLLGQVHADTLNGGDGNDILTGGTAGDSFIFNGTFGVDTITDFGFADVAYVQGTSAGYNSFSDYDVNSDGLVNSVDAGLTGKVVAGPGGDLTLLFDGGGTRSVFFDDVGFLNSGDLIFI